LLLQDLHVGSLSFQNRYDEAVEVGITHLRALGVELMPAMTPDLSSWIFSVPDLADESTYKQHPVFAMPEMSDEKIAMAMHLLSVLDGEANTLAAVARLSASALVCKHVTDRCAVVVLIGLFGQRLCSSWVLPHSCLSRGRCSI